MPNEAPVVDSVAPVTTAAPAPATPEASTPEPSAAPEGAPPEGEQAPKPEETPKQRLFTQEELNRAARRERKAAEARAYERARLELENQRLREQLGQPRGDQPTNQGAGDAEPRPEDFKDYGAYTRAIVRWEIQQEAQQAAKAAKSVKSAESFNSYANEVRQTLAKGSEQYEDFEEAITAPGVVFTDAMVDAVIRTEKPADVAYYLGTHPEESQRIGALPLAAQVREIDKIAATLAKPPAPSKAPEPIKPNAGTAASVEQTLESTANNYQDWLKVRRRQLAQTGR